MTLRREASRINGTRILLLRKILSHPPGHEPKQGAAVEKDQATTGLRLLTAGRTIFSGLLFFMKLGDRQRRVGREGTLSAFLLQRLPRRPECPCTNSHACFNPVSGYACAYAFMHSTALSLLMCISCCSWFTLTEIEYFLFSQLRHISSDY